MPSGQRGLVIKRAAVNRCKTLEAARALEGELGRFDGRATKVQSRLADGTADQVAQNSGGAGNEAWQKLNELDRESLAKLKLLAEKLDSPLFKALYLLAKGTK